MIAALKLFPSQSLQGTVLSFLFAFLLPLSAQEGWLLAPDQSSKPVNQLRTSGNACGPACLLDAFRAGGKKWRKSLEKIPGTTDTEKVTAIIKSHANKASKINPVKTRWNPRRGVSGVDLAAMANDMRTSAWMGTVKQKILFQKGKESSPALLHRVHKSLTKSLKKGLPPILAIRRMAHRGKPRQWLNVKRHFVVLTGLPAKLPPNAASFEVTYHDPWGGKSYSGKIRITDAKTASVSTLIAEFPQSKIGRKLIRGGEATTLSLSSAVGVF